MDRIKKWFRRIPIPAAFVICGMAALLSALSLTRTTMWFARKNMGEIAGSYMEPVLDLAPEPSREAGSEEDSAGSAEAVSEPDSAGSAESVTEPDTSNSAAAPSEPEIAGSVAAVSESDAASSSETVPEPETADSSETISEQNQLGFRMVEPELISPGEALPVEAQVILLEEEDRIKYDFYDSLDNIAAVLWYSVCLCLASLVFYLWKMRKPLRLLNQAARKISDNDLDFQIDYIGQDELGRLCQAFESMRQELVQNNRKLWNSVEERKRLNAAFAHDLRTPLTVLQGHTDLLLDTLEEGPEIGAETTQEILSSVQAISNQVTRMNSYLDTMSALRRLEDYEPCLKPVSSEALKELLEENAASLFPGEKSITPGTPKAAVRFELEDLEFWMDREAVSQIYENLLSNAARYARCNIRVRLYREQDFLVLEVADDGAGFTPKDLENAFAPYYKGQRSKPASSAHFGLGLYICSLLAGKLGGGIQLANGEGGGAVVTVKLACYPKKFM